MTLCYTVLLAEYTSAAEKTLTSCATPCSWVPIGGCCTVQRRHSFPVSRERQGRCRHCAGRHQSRPVPCQRFGILPELSSCTSASNSYAVRCVSKRCPEYPVTSLKTSLVARNGGCVQCYCCYLVGCYIDRCCCRDYLNAASLCWWLDERCLYHKHPLMTHLSPGTVSRRRH